ncbi:MAG: glycosyltransferase [Cyclobacteriaceae bacterium]|nr:glycosyltransferase [Cyclobacteriaceae bacterium]
MPQVNKIRRIVIASVLKPVDETRMFEKIGGSLAHAGHDVHIIGFPTAKEITAVSGITLHPITEEPFSRLSLTRFLASFRAFFIALKLKPKYLIIATHELLLMAFWCKMFTGCTVLYDMQENYYRNIRFTEAFPAGLRFLLACWVRLKEYLLRPVIATYLLAEKGYEQELRFARPCIVLENKITHAVAEQFRKNEQTGYSRLLFSGTLAETTGVFHAIELAKELHRLDVSFTLTIIGHCASAITFKKLQELAQQDSFIRLLASERPLPHDAILQEVNRADFGIIWYPPNLSTACSIPTKLYEYIGLNLPVLISHNAESHNLVEQHNAGIILHQPIDYQELISNMKSFKLSENNPELYFDNDVSALMGLLE